MRTISEANQALIAEGWTVETFDGQQITRKTDGGKYLICIRSHHAIANGRRSLAGIFYRFQSEAAREAWFSHWKEQREAKAADRQAKVTARRQARSAFVNPYHVGDVLHSSWGYEQTNVEFYEVTAVRQTSVQLREIAATLKTDGALAMSGSKTACPGQYMGEPKWVTIQIRVYEGNVSHHIPSPRHGELYPTKPGQSIGCSWYA